MEADIVPICRIRRNTSWWTYRMPASYKCSPGSVVQIPFRGKPVLGVVWHVRERDEHSGLESVLSVLSPHPLVRQPQRELIEWLSETGVCSLSSALAQWCPRALREPDVPAYARELFAAYNAWASSPIAQQPRQAMYLLPSYRKETVETLRSQFSASPCFSDASEREELETWFSIAMGNTPAVSGRERALYAPYVSLGSIHIFDPEDISYYHEQTPYVHMVDAALQLSTATSAPATLHSYLPEPIVSSLWKAPSRNPGAEPGTCECIGITKEGILSPGLVDRVRATVSRNKSVLILYNARDRLASSNPQGERTIIPGIETIRKRLAHLLGYPELPHSISVDTRAIFQTAHTNVGLCIALSLDPLLSETLFANKLHGWSDIIRLFSYKAPVVIQARDTSHPLVHALINSRLASYMEAEIDEQRTHHLPPFAHYVVCSIPADDEAHEASRSLYVELKRHAESPWTVSQPFVNVWRKKEYIHVFLFSRSRSRIPVVVRDILCKLPRPWRVQHNPWHLF